MPARLTALALIALPLLTATFAPAAENPGRVLNGHEFMPSAVVPDPFVVTSFATKTPAVYSR